MKNYRVNTLIGILVIMLLLGGEYYIFRDKINPAVSGLMDRIRPCRQAITYTIGDLDPRFDMAREELIKIAESAQGIWGSSINRELFKYSQDGKLRINLLYDYRQETTNDLDKVKSVLNIDKATIDELKAEQKKLISEYNESKSKIESMERTYRSNLNVYEGKVNEWNRKSVHSNEDLKMLEQMRERLTSQLMSVNQEKSIYNNLVDSIKVSQTKIEDKAKKYNSTVLKYNEIGSSTGDRFDEGEYVYDSGKSEIYIYQFKDKDQLKRVLSHEFGHALGLEHVENPKSIMYYLNVDGNDILTPEDTSELKKACKID